MSIYEGEPNPDKLFYRSKFVRIRDIVAVTEPNDTETSHAVLVEKDGLSEEFKRVSAENPDQVDGGIITFARISPKNPTITLKGTLQEGSHSLKVFKSTEARNITITVLQNKTPGYRIKNI